nr:DUF86 domain-containing protein [Candidatus Eremiobacteraeota bacterium]
DAMRVESLLAADLGREVQIISRRVRRGTPFRDLPRHDPSVLNVAQRSAAQRIADIYTNLEAARRYVDGWTQDRFDADDEKQQAVLHRLQNASEAATRLKAEWPDEYDRLERDHPDAVNGTFENLIPPK